MVTDYRALFATENKETGKVCFDCGQPEFTWDEPFGMRQVESGHIVVSCCK